MKATLSASAILVVFLTGCSNITMPCGEIAKAQTSAKEPRANEKKDQAKAAEEPSYNGRSLSEWIVRLKALTNAERAEAALSLGQMGKQAQKAVPALIAALSDDSWNDDFVLCRAAVALSKIGDRGPNVLKALGDALADRHPSVRATAATSLDILDDQSPSVVQALTEALNDGDSMVRATAAHALWKLTRDPVVIPILIVTLRDENLEVRGVSARALGKVGPVTPEVAPALVEACKRAHEELEQVIFLPKPNTTEQTVRRLPTPASYEDSFRQLHGRKVWLPVLFRQLYGRKVWTDIIVALGEMGTQAEPALPILCDAIEKGDQAALDVIGRLGPLAKKAAPALRKLLANVGGLTSTRDICIDLRLPARAMKYMKYKAADLIYVKAARVLAQVDSDAKVEALNVLADLYLSGDEFVRESAAAAFRAVAPGESLPTTWTEVEQRFPR
jgi:HEAT repeat protein